VIAKLNFQQLLLQSSVTWFFRNHLVFMKHLLLLSMLKKVVLL